MTGSADTIHEIKAQMVGIHHRMQANEEILLELKEVVKVQHKTIIEIVKMQEKQQVFDRDVLQLRQDFDDRNEKIEPILTEFRTSNAKWKGVIMASVFFFSLLQSVLVYVWNDSQSNMKSEITEIKQSIKEIRDHK